MGRGENRRHDRLRSVRRRGVFVAARGPRLRVDSLAVDVVEAEVVGVGQAAQVDGGDNRRHDRLRRGGGRRRRSEQSEVRDAGPCKQQNMKLHPQ